MTLLSIFAARVLYLYTYVTAPSQNTQQVQAVKIKCDWVPNDLKNNLENIAGNFGGLTLFIGSILGFVAVIALAVAFATKYRNMLLLVLAGLIFVGSIAASGVNFVNSTC